MSSKSENEHEFSEEKDSSQAESSEAGKSCGLEAYDTNNIVGTKIEAQDFDGKWHPARVAEFDTSENEILIHYENWNSKFDEWIPMDSSRLRLMLQSEPECITQPSIEGVKFAKGEQVIAQWSVNQKYPGTIQSVLSNDRYEVLFYDGFLKRLKSQKISKMSGGVIQNEIKNFADIGTKEERRERKRKINVAELFHINKRSKKKGLIHANPPEVKTYAVNRSRARNSSIGKNDAASPMSPTCTGASETGEVTSPATVDNSPVTTVVTPTTLTLDSEPRTTTGTILASDIETVNNSVESPAPKAERKVTTQSHSSKAVLHSVPTAVEVKYRDGRTATWTKQMYQRSEGRTAGKIDIIIINPQGRKFRSRTEIMKYCEENGIIYSHDAFDFSAKGRPKSKSIVQVKTETSSNEVDNNIAKPLSNASLEASLASSASTLAPVSAPALLPPPHSHPGIRSQLLTTVPIEQHDPQENKVFIGDVEVLTDNGKLICPDKKCAKHFRRENLLHMHMKHYHPEFSKYLDYTPSVTDLAYARTVGSLEPIDGPQQASRKSLNAERYERTPNKSDHARRASSSVIEGSRETKKSTFKTSDVKVEMKSPLQSLKSTSNTVVSPTVDINQECTEENDSNKAVDNSETFKDTLQQNSFTQTTNESAEPNLEQACFEANSNADSILQTHATYRSAKSNRHHRSRKTNRFQGSFSGHIRRRKYGGRDHRRSNYKISKRQLETQIQQPEIEEPTEQPQPQLHQQQQQQPQQEQLLQQQPQTQPPSISSSLTEDQSNSNTSSHAFATSRCQKQLIAPNEISGKNHLLTNSRIVCSSLKKSKKRKHYSVLQEKNKLVIKVRTCDNEANHDENEGKKRTKESNENAFIESRNRNSLTEIRKKKKTKNFPEEKRRKKKRNWNSLRHCGYGWILDWNKSRKLKMRREASNENLADHPDLKSDSISESLAQFVQKSEVVGSDFNRRAEAEEIRIEETELAECSDIRHAPNRNFISNSIEDCTDRAENIHELIKDEVLSNEEINRNPKKIKETQSNYSSVRINPKRSDNNDAKRIERDPTKAYVLLENISNNKDYAEALANQMYQKRGAIRKKQISRNNSREKAKSQNIAKKRKNKRVRFENARKKYFDSDDYENYEVASNYLTSSVRNEYFRKWNYSELEGEEEEAENVEDEEDLEVRKPKEGKLEKKKPKNYLVNYLNKKSLSLKTARLDGPQRDEKRVSNFDLSGDLDNAEGTEDSKSPLTVENEKVEKLRRNEIINCVCGLSEEDGLMIQCDICLCWQHGHCAQILRDSDVPDKYICSICKNPFRGRSSMKYIHDQDWLKEGNLPSLSFRSKREDVINQRRGILKRSHDLSGSISLLSQVIHSLRVKVNIAEKKDHPKLWLWAKKWNEKKPSRLKDVDMKPDNLAACNVDVNGDIKVEGSLGEEQLVPKAPEPEAPIDSAECRLNLLDHLVHYQSLVDARLSYIENLVAELESMQEDAADDETAERYPRTKATVQMILRDLNTMKKIAAIS